MLSHHSVKGTFRKWAPSTRGNAKRLYAAWLLLRECFFYCTDCQAATLLSPSVHANGTLDVTFVCAQPRGRRSRLLNIKTSVRGKLTHFILITSDFSFTTLYCHPSARLHHRHSGPQGARLKPKTLSPPFVFVPLFFHFCLQLGIPVKMGTAVISFEVTGRQPWISRWCSCLQSLRRDYLTFPGKQPRKWH